MGPTELDAPAAPAAPELIVLSDFHLGRGFDEGTRRYHPLEPFFSDDDFHAFCRFLVDDARARGVSLRMVLAGDVFDLLRAHADGNADESRFAPLASAEAAAEVLGAILAGHPGVVAGWALLVAAGHEVVLLPGNHDIELQWAAPGERLRAAVAAALPGDPREARAAVDARLRVEPWFHYEPGRVWIEHGCQYDADGVFRYPLRGREAAVSAAGLERDLPLGNFFQRYVFNGFGATAFLVPSNESNRRYVRWLLVHRPRRLVQVIARHVPLAWRLFVRLGRDRGPEPPVLRETHERELARLAAENALGEQVYDIDRLKVAQADVVTALRDATLASLRAIVAPILLLLLGSVLWHLTLEVPRALSWGFAARLGVFAVVSLLVALVSFTWMLRALFRPPAPTPSTLPAAAQRIAAILDVPLVIFGHTHAETVRPLARPSGSAWYYNTGTWIAVFARDILLPRAPVQLSYVRVRGGDAQLLHFEAPRAPERPAVLLAEGDWA